MDNQHELTPEKILKQSANKKIMPLKPWKAGESLELLVEDEFVTVKRHELSSIFNEMDTKTFQELIKSIQTDGLKDPKITAEKKMVKSHALGETMHYMIIDGWHRFKICSILDITDQIQWNFIEIDDSSKLDVIKQVAQANLYRRHLTPKQRAAAMVRLTAFQYGKEIIWHESKSQSARLAGVSETSVAVARREFKQELEGEPVAPKPQKEKKFTKTEIMQNRKIEKLETIIGKLQKDNHKLQDSREKLLQTIEELKNQISMFKPTENDIEKLDTINQMRTERNSYKKSVDAFTAEVENLTNELSEANEKIESLELEITELKENGSA